MRVGDYPIKSVCFNQVNIDDSFWKPRQSINSNVTIWSNFRKCEETERIANFERAAGLRKGRFVGLRFNDSDVYKSIEAAAYSLQTAPDTILVRYVDALIELIASAQWSDGYLDTFYSLGPEKVDPRFPPETQKKGMRWTNLRHMHELYCAGHLLEAAVAYYEATGKRRILDVACNLADHIDSTFGWDKMHGTSGHEEVELGLCRLHRVTGDEKYLRLAKYFIDQRGRREGRSEPDYTQYAQDHKPVIEQDEAVGHAVRAEYLYAAVAEVAALTGDRDYIESIDRIWENVVSKKIYVTGGVGAIPKDEAFGGNYELPNKTAYNETCAAIGNIFWNHRMFLLHGESKYIDVLERTLYNGFLSGVSLKGNEYFYSNPLEADGVTRFNRGFPSRSPWFDCSCCPPNIARLLASLSGYIYARRDDRIFVNLIIGSNAHFKLNDTSVKITQRTDYPWKGDVKIILEPERPKSFDVAVRIPGWARNMPVPSDLYSYLDEEPPPPVIRVNGLKFETRLIKGYASISRTWTKGDEIELSLPMKIRRLIANGNVKADMGLVAVERGPIVFCVEEADNSRTFDGLKLAEDTKLRYRFSRNLLNGVGVITGSVGASVKNPEEKLTMVPYYSWSNRGAGKMRVWLTRTRDPQPHQTLEKS